jgi:dihydrodiol dehydrogenase / D-xylose 1-dehydrogenase (NADP)
LVRSIRWGILGTGTIAKKFAADLRTLPDAELAAVGSRASGTAGEFARLFGITTYHSSYQDLAADPRVDVVYIATPHVFHFENTLLCLENGKSVLCEKPFCLNSHQAAKIIACARKRKLFLMEAMWTRFLPAIVQLRHYVDEGIIGEIKLISANLGFKTDFGRSPAGHRGLSYFAYHDADRPAGFHRKQGSILRYRCRRAGHFTF